MLHQALNIPGASRNFRPPAAHVRAAPGPGPEADGGTDRGGRRHRIEANAGMRPRGARPLPGRGGTVLSWSCGMARQPRLRTRQLGTAPRSGRAQGLRRSLARRGGRGGRGGRSGRGLPGLRERAQGRLRRFRRTSQLAVALTALLLLLWGGDTSAFQDGVPRTVDTAVVTGAGTSPERTTGGVEESVDEAARGFQSLVLEVQALLPKLGFALGIILVATLLTKLVRPGLRRLLGSWDRADAVSAIVAVAIWVTAVAAVIAVVAGNARALFGSVGLLGLAASWALQAPIESFAGWLLNSFRGYYRLGDRIAVGDVFGDVYRIDVLTTTLWEAGGPDKPVQGAQPTGAVVTFPNSEILRANIINYTREFPYVWDEIRVGVALESDPVYTMRAIGKAAREVVGAAMQGPAQSYRSLMEAEGLALEVADEPQLYLDPQDAWLNVVVRYLVPARERRTWATRLHVQINEELNRPEHAGRIVATHPTQRVRLEPPPS